MAFSVAEDFLDGYSMGVVPGEARDAESERLAMGVEHYYLVTCLELFQTPEDGGSVAGAIKVSVDDGTAGFAGAWSQIIPADVVPKER